MTLDSEWIRILHKAQCFQGNLGKIAKSIPLVSVGPCLLRQGKNNKYYQFTNTGLLHSSDLQRQFNLSKQIKNVAWQQRSLTLPHACTPRRLEM